MFDVCLVESEQPSGLSSCSLFLYTSSFFNYQKHIWLREHRVLLVKPLVVKNLFSCEALLWVEGQHLSNEVREVVKVIIVDVAIALAVKALPVVDRRTHIILFQVDHLLER